MSVWNSQIDLLGKMPTPPSSYAEAYKWYSENGMGKEFIRMFLLYTGVVQKGYEDDLKTYALKRIADFAKQDNAERNGKTYFPES